MIKTITLTGAEQEVTFDGNNTYCWVQNLGSADLLVSLSSGIVDGADNVLTIPSGGAGYVRDDTSVKKLYILGTGKVQVYGTNNAFCPFKMASGGGDSGGSSGAIDEEARADIADINARVPYKILTGTVTTNSDGEASVTFTEPFETVPSVCCTVRSALPTAAYKGAIACSVKVIDTKSFSINSACLYRKSTSENAVATTATINIQWVAIGT